jgi:hypothetical protein
MGAPTTRKNGFSEKRGGSPNPWERSEKTKRRCGGGGERCMGPKWCLNGALVWTNGFEWFFVQCIGHIWINEWSKSQLHILKNHFEFVFIFRQKPPSHFSFLTQHQISWQLRMSSTCSSYRIFSLELSLVLTNFWILWSQLTLKQFNGNRVQIFSWLNVLRINSCIKSILIISRIFSHCLNSCLMHNSDLVKYHFTLSNFHPSKYLTY